MWYSVSLLFVAVSAGAQDSGRLWQERIVLVDTATEEEARTIAEELAKQGEHGYRTSSGPLRWEFRQVERRHAIEGLIRSGIEVFSRFLRDSEVASLLTPFE
jgi:hypothetical protein